MIPLPLFLACMTGPVALCTPLMGPHNASVATGWVGERGNGVWQWWDYDGTLCRADRHPTCLRFDADGDGDVDLEDFGILQRG